MYFDESIQEWRYKDDQTLVKDHWQLRPCGHCDRHVTPEGHDGCLGTLPGVMNACCGHGVVADAYIQLSKYVVLRGPDAIEWLRKTT